MTKFTLKKIEEVDGKQALIDACEWTWLKTAKKLIKILK